MGAGFLPSQADPVAVQIARFATSCGVAADPVEGAWDGLRRSGLAQPGLAFAAWVETVALGGLLTPIVANCPDVGTALAELERFHPLLEQDRIVLVRWPQSASLAMCSPGGGPAHPETVDAFFAVLCRVLRRLAGERALPSQVMLRRPAPVRRDDYDSAFGTPTVFSQAADSCRFGANALRAPIDHADPAVRRALVPHAEHRISRRRAPWSAAVSELADAGTLGLAQVAGALAVSPRTLQLRLEDEGASFAAVIDAVRKERALALLAEPGLPISAIAARTGFATPSAFTRAFRRWTGLPPSRYRRTAEASQGQQQSYA
jgi:AraC-like DNA-binding protein